ncbi:MAG: hypothetical protein AAF439_07535 [Pseudomonadota bacterium]
MATTLPRLAPLGAPVGDNEPDAIVGRHEGVSPDEVAKLRLWHLQAQSQNIMRQTILADTKAATLLALIGLVATRVALQVEPANFGALELLLFTNKAVVLCLCLHVIMPRFPRRADWSRITGFERYSWTGLANPMEPDCDYGAFASAAAPSQMFTSIARANQGAAKVLRFKFKWLRIAFLLAIADVVLTLTYFSGGGIAQ